MRFLTLIFFLIFSPGIFGQSTFSGKIIDKESGKPLPFAIITTDGKLETLSNIKGEFFVENTPENEFIASYPGYHPQKVKINSYVNFIFIELLPLRDKGKTQTLSDEGLNAEEIIRLAIKNKEKNDPENALRTYTYDSYNKLFIDDQYTPGLNSNRSSREGKAFLTEKVSVHYFKKYNLKKEVVTGLETHGFEDPVYEVLTLNLDPPSIYYDDYTVYGTTYAGPLGKNALRNYRYFLLDTVESSGRPGYLVFFEPKRPQTVAGLHGVLFLDKKNLAVQKVELQLLGKFEMYIQQEFIYIPEEEIWFPKEQRTVLKPGTGGKDISIFGGSISVGTVQRKNSILKILIPTEEIEKNLELVSTTINYGITLNQPVEIDKNSAAIKVLDEASSRSYNFWQEHRQKLFTVEEELTGPRVEKMVEVSNVQRKREVLNAISNGSYPLGFWNFDLSKFIKYNNHEGFRIGVGGETNEKFSENFRLNGYGVYGLTDQKFKYGVGGGALIYHRTGTWFNLRYNQDIQEVGSHNYLRGVKDFSILEPRFANISYYYSFKGLSAGLEHRFTPRLDTELLFSTSEISQIGEYAFFNNGVIHRNYSITEATFGFLWRPFSKFLSTPTFHQIYEKDYPVITGQITKGISGVLEGDFDFTKLGLKAEYQITRKDKSVTQVTLEGNYGLGELPLTHAFHAFPNNPNKEEILQRFSVAGNISFETMYFNEFFSDRQASIHVRHQLRPINISSSIQPEFAIISRHVIGDFNNKEFHRNIEFNTLENVYSEVGLELNKILFGIGLSTAYRYGAYHLPAFKENFSLKFTFQLKI